jgi:glycosyltransferase involved in cell wall biosynthesis
VKIGFICNEYPPSTCGGIGTFTRELAEQLVALGHEVRVIGVYADIQRATVVEQNQVIVERLPATAGWRGIVSNRRRLYQRVKQLQNEGLIDLIESPDFEGYSAFWGKLTIPLVVRLHGTVTYFSHQLGQPVNPLIRLIERNALKSADKLVSVSHYAAKQSFDIFDLQKTYDLVHNGVAWPLATDVKQTYAYSGKVVFTGSIMPKKGVLSLARAWPAVRQVFPDAELIIIGKDTQNRGVSVKAQMLEIVGKEHSITFTGHISKQVLQDYLRDADVAIFPSFSESFGLGPVESMALAVPTIYTELSCGPEIIQHQENGLLVNPEHPQAIASSLIRLMSDEKQRVFYGRAGRAHAAQFSVDAQLMHNVNVFQQVIETKSL